uniref:BEACH domain-containing protein n=1 Tax=Biomphalaria glabrata TaxID=6526 RepID=A0A2C9M808_BIOGL
ILLLPGSIGDIVNCSDKVALQALVMSDNLFEGLVSLLKGSQFQGLDLQKLACAIVKTLQSIFSGSPSAKGMFEMCVGYNEFLQILKDCGQPSRELLVCLLDLIEEGPFQTTKCHVIRNTQAAVLLMKWVEHIQTPELQVWLSEEMKKVCTASYGNRMACCRGQMVGVLISLLQNHLNLQLKTVGHVICLLERLGNLSISASELKSLIGLLKPSADKKQYPYTTRLMRSLSFMARRDGLCGPLHFFDIQNLSDVINLPGIRKWPGPGFSFFTLLCLEPHPSLERIRQSVSSLSSFSLSSGTLSSPYYRRIIYSFSSSSGCGLEAFVTSGLSLTVATFSKKDYSTVTVPEVTLDDGYWHSICIVHLAGRRFSNSPGQVIVYIDGKLRTTAPLKFPSLSEPFNICQVGSPGKKLTTECVSDTSANSQQEVKKVSSTSPKYRFEICFNYDLSQLRGSDTSTSGSNVNTLASGAQEETWGPVTCLHGQMESICVFHDSLQSDQVKALHQMSVNSLFHFSTDAIMADLPSKLIARYSAKACKGSVCADLSPFQNHGTFSGNKCINWDLKDVINCLGGIQVLFPLIELLDQRVIELPDESPSSPTRGEAEELDLDDWAIVDSRASLTTEIKLDHNQLAAFITMLRCMLKEKSVNRDNFVRSHCASTLGMLMQKLLEAMDLLISLLENPNRKQDQLILLLYEAYQAEMFYKLLTYPRQPIIFYEKIVKILYILLKSERVYEKNKSRLRLADIGHWGLVNLMSLYDISAPMIKRFIEQVSFTETPQTYGAVLAVLGLVHNCGMDIKSEASRQLLAIIVSKSGAAKGLAKQLGWQENITRLLTLDRKRAFSVVGEDISSAARTLRPRTQRMSVSEESIVAHPETGHAGGKQDIDETDPHLEQKFVFDESAEEKISKAGPDSVFIPDSISAGSPTRPTMLPFPFSSPDKDNEDILQMMEEPAPNTPLYIKRKSSTLPMVSRDERESLEVLSPSKTPEEMDTLLALEERSRPMESLVEDKESFKKIVLKDLFYTSIQVLDHVGVELNDATEQKEELCQNVLIILLSIMWKGIEGSSSQAWNERCQVLTWIGELGDSHELIRPPDEIKRRLLEMMLHNCTTDIKNSGVQTPVALMENAAEIMRLVQDFVTRIDVSQESFSTRLLEDVMLLLTALGIWDSPAMVAWTDMIHRGFSILLAFSKQPNLELVSASSVKLHAFVQTKLISSSAEASYILGVLNSIILKSIEENSDNYTFLMNVLRALIEKGQELLTTSIHLPHLPKTSMNPSFFDDFKTYVYSEEWQRFISSYVAQQMTHFIESNFEQDLASMSTFWSDCHEQMMMNHHKHNREIGESRLKFKAHFDEVYQKKVDLETRRFLNMQAQQKNQHLFALRQWRATKRFFTGERGTWRSGQQQEVHWKLSNQENFQRMKVKLTQNYNFDSHINASRLRDNLGVIDVDNSIHLEELKSVKDALVSKEDIADDSLGDEEWSAISASSANMEEYTGTEKLVISADCDLITVTDDIKGRLEVTTTHVYFFDCSPHKEEGGEDFKWSLSRLREIHFRRYNLRRSALEVFLIDQTNYFINFPEKQMRNKIYSHILSLRPSNLIYKGQRSPADLLKASGLTQETIHVSLSHDAKLLFSGGYWDNSLQVYSLTRPKVINHIVRHIGAVDLDAIQDPKERLSVEGMIRNFGQTPSQLLKEPHPKRLTFDEAVTKSAKSGKPMSIFNFLKDLKPFFVHFPWILTDYTSKHLDLENPKSFRDLSKPIGVVNPRNEEEVREKYDTFEDPSGMIEKFHYGTHYSNAASVMHYLVRVEPFTTLHIELQSGKFDVADRQFHSIPGSFASLMDNPNDVKELIPEFFYFPEFLVNFNGEDNATDRSYFMMFLLKPVAGVSVNLNSKPLQTLYGHDSEVTAVHISTELDLVVSASKDGTVILHTVLKGHYTMTLRAPSQLGWTLDIPLMAVSDTGQIVLYCVEMEKQTGEGRRRQQERHCLHLYSVNGKHLFSEPLTSSLGDMCMSGDHLILGNGSGQLTVMEIFGLRPLTTMELLLPIQCITLSNGNSHILVGLRDGKLIIIGNKGK